jgi:hypothetical protein
VATTTLEGQGQLCYFLGEETGREFSGKNKSAIKLTASAWKRAGP